MNHPSKKYIAPLIGLLFVIVCLGLSSRVDAKETTLAEISTKAGRVLLIQRDSEKAIVFKDQTIYTGTNEMKIYHFFRPRTTYDAILLRDFKGPIYCPVTYQFIIFKPDQTFSLPEPFGHCSDKPDMTIKDTTITIRFKPFAELPGAVYVFDGNSLQKTE